jgi:hypothetical protein
MHTVDLGIWVHMMRAIAVRIDDTLRSHGILTEREVNEVWIELVERSDDWDGDATMFHMNQWKGKYLKHLLDCKRNHEQEKKLEAWEHHILMLVCM